MTLDEPKPNDCLLASAIQFLIEGGENIAANVLLSCSLHTWVTNSIYCNSEEVCNIAIKLTGPRAAYEQLNNRNHPIRQAVENALKACLQENIGLDYITVHAQRINADSDWRSEMLEIARGSDVSNQVAGERIEKILTWNNLRFRSVAEKKIAQAFDKAGVLFLPNCKARLGSCNDRKNREPDFLVCHNGKWGILEVDGEPFHPPSRTVDDHERDRLFKMHGITVAEHFDATKCFNKPDEVVSEFLKLLK